MASDDLRDETVRMFTAQGMPVLAANRLADMAVKLGERFEEPPRASADRAAAARSAGEGSA